MPRFKSNCNGGNDTFECPLRGKRCSGRRRDGTRCRRNTYRPYEMCWQHLRSQMYLNVSGPSANTTLRDANGNLLPFKGLKANVPAAVRRRRERAWDNGEVARSTRQAGYVRHGPHSHRWNYCNIAFRPRVSGPCTPSDVHEQSCKVVVPKYIGQLITNARRNRRYGSNSTAPYCIYYGRHQTIDGACKRGVANYANHKSPSRANAHLQAFHDAAAGEDAWRILATKNIYHGDEVFVNYGRRYRNVGATTCEHSTK